MGYLYMITNMINGKSYIGQSINNPETGRILDHLNRRATGSPLLKKAITKYGIENFSYKILAQDIMPDLLNLFEKASIKSFKTLAPHGYNLHHGGSKSPIDEPRSETSQRGCSGQIYLDPSIGKMRRMRGKRCGVKLHKPQKEKAYELYISLPSKLTLTEKRKHLIDEFAGVVNPKTVYRWIEQWSPEEVSSSKPLRKPRVDKSKKEQVHKIFVSLPSSLSITEKRKCIYEKFRDVHPATVCRWIKEWAPTQVGTSHKSKKYYAEIKERAYSVYLSLDSSLTLIEKKNHLYAEFPDISRKTIRNWIRQWQSELENNNQGDPLNG